MKSSDPFKVWVSHNALSEGVREVEVITQGHGMVSETAKRPGSFSSRWYMGEGKQWHRTRDGAVTKAEVMRVKRIASLKAQIEKLEALKFQ
jgi:hypothetical protein